MAVDTRFYLLDREKKIRDIWKNCNLCQSVAKIPLEIHQYDMNEVPDHPGASFTIDILRMFKKIIMVSTDNFSGFISTMFLCNEKADTLLDGIIHLTTPFKMSSSTLVSIRTDQAPGFKSLKIKEDELMKLGISLELGNPKNKNALAIVDKKMQELECELKKMTQGENSVSLKSLARSTLVVNEKVRNQGLSSKEIMFCRDQFSHSNIPIKDEEIANQIKEARESDNIASAKSKAQIKTPALPANAYKSNLVFFKKRWR